MIQAVLLLASVLGASVYLWQHNKELSFMQTLDKVNPNDMRAPKFDIHPILRNTCRWPVLSKNEEDVRKFLAAKRPQRRSQCSLPSNFEVLWVRDTSTISFIPNNIHNNSVKCILNDLSPMDLESIQLEPDIEVNVPFSSFFVECYENENVQPVFRKSFMNPTKAIIEQPVESTATNPSIAILYLKSMSILQLQREFPRTIKMAKNLGYHTYNAMMKLSENSSENIYRSFNHAGIGENVSEYMKNRYCTILTNDPETSGIRSDIEMGPFLASLKMDTCMDENEKSRVLLEEWWRFSREMTEKCHFSAIFLENQLDEGRLDEALNFALDSFLSPDVYKDTVVMIISAEGIPVGHFGKTYTGKVEERNPIFMVHVPEKMKKVRADHVFHLEQNINRIISHLDVFETIRSFTRITKNQVIVPMDRAELQAIFEEKRGISIWQSLVPDNRTCEEAFVPDELCLCMENQIEIEKAYNSTNEMTSRVFEKMETEILNQTFCLSDATFVPTQNATLVYNLNSKILKGTDDYIEYFYFTIRTFAKPNKHRTNFFDVLGQFKHFLNDDGYRIELSHPYIIDSSNNWCFAGYLDRVCEMCHSGNVLLTS